MNPLGLRGGLRFGACAGASDHQHLRSPGRRGKADLPLNSMSPSEASIMCAASLRTLATILSLTMVRVPPLIGSSASRRCQRLSNNARRDAFDLVDIEVTLKRGERASSEMVSVMSRVAGTHRCRHARPG